MEQLTAARKEQWIMGGFTEILGKADLEMVLDAAGYRHDFHASGSRKDHFLIGSSELCRIQNSIRHKFGDRSGKGILFRLGSAVCRNTRLFWESALGFTSDEARFFTPQQRISWGLEKFAAELSRDLNMEIGIENDRLAWKINLIPPGSSGSDADCCQFVMGILREFLNWAGNGKTYSLDQAACLSQNHTCCQGVISKTPLDA